ncbi:hypothetical protein STEG23_001677, partial [Scotinomys teguina]
MQPSLLSKHLLLMNTLLPAALSGVIKSNTRFSILADSENFHLHQVILIVHKSTSVLTVIQSSYGPISLHTTGDGLWTIRRIPVQSSLKKQLFIEVTYEAH